MVTGSLVATTACLPSGQGTTFCVRVLGEHHPCVQGLLVEHLEPLPHARGAQAEASCKLSHSPLHKVLSNCFERLDNDVFDGLLEESKRVTSGGQANQGKANEDERGSSYHHFELLSECGSYWPVRAVFNPQLPRKAKPQ